MKVWFCFVFIFSSILRKWPVSSVLSVGHIQDAMLKCKALTIEATRNKLFQPNWWHLWHLFSVLTDMLLSALLPAFKSDVTLNINTSYMWCLWCVSVSTRADASMTKASQAAVNMWSKAEGYTHQTNRIIRI